MGSSRAGVVLPSADGRRRHRGGGAGFRCAGRSHGSAEVGEKIGGFPHKSGRVDRCGGTGRREEVGEEIGGFGLDGGCG